MWKEFLAEPSGWIKVPVQQLHVPSACIAFVSYQAALWGLILPVLMNLTGCFSRFGRTLRIGAISASDSHFSSDLTLLFRVPLVLIGLNF